jgi:hypothetical protein
MDVCAGRFPADSTPEKSAVRPNALAIWARSNETDTVGDRVPWGGILQFQVQTSKFNFWAENCSPICLAWLPWFHPLFFDNRPVSG